MEVAIANNQCNPFVSSSDIVNEINSICDKMVQICNILTFDVVCKSEEKRLKAERKRLGTEWDRLAIELRRIDPYNMDVM
jgi:hypothetical protein